MTIRSNAYRAARAAALTLVLASCSSVVEPVETVNDYQPYTSADFEVGKPFPLITLPSLDGGQPMSLASFRGKKVLLHVFASW